MGKTPKTPEELQKEADAKVIADAKKIKDKEIADAKAIEDKKIEDKKVEDAKKVVADKKAADEKEAAEKSELAQAQKVADDKKAEDAEKAKNEVKLFNVLGKEVPKSDYFFGETVPAGFVGTCGKPVDREDLITLFHKVFKPEDNILFYKQADKEVYIVIIPIKYATEIGDFNDSLEGDFQKHAISFLTEGSVNLDTMRQKLDRVNKFVNYSDR